MRFKFKAIKQNGDRYEGVRESSDKFTLYADLKADGDTLITAQEVGEKNQVLSKILGMFDTVPMHQRIIFAKNLGSMIDAGLPLARALSVLEKQIKNKKLKSTIVAMSLNIRKGKTLSESVRMYPNIFSNLFVSMVKAGEESGRLAESLGIVAGEMDGMYKLKNKIRGAMIYPCVIISIMIFTTAILKRNKKRG